MKKILAIILTVALTVCCFTACSGEKKDDGKLHIVTTIFPEYDWALNVLGENPAEAEVVMLLDNGVDLHSYQPTVDDIMKVASCDLFIYVGGESDGWVKDALAQATNKNMIVINLLEVLGDKVKEEEIVEGMEHEHDHDHEDGDHDDDDHDHDHEDGDHEEHDHDHEHEDGEVEYDEHVWLSLRNAETLVKAISQAVEKLDSANAEAYRKNTEAYVGKLRALDERYKTAVAGATNRTLLFGDRFPFRYLTDDYGLKYYAAFVGCSAETEASFETIKFLTGKVDELGLSAVMTIEGANHKIAETIVANTQAKNQKILQLNSLQSTTSEDVKKGATYLSVMEANLAVLTDALK
ncbi:MAG: metal ABC transporter substrate-binding protein [Lachnospiraceae bacterium]|nr:metal ABC transporter substrate-binding protein [Lachnospiraceae bacterium]